MMPDFDRDGRPSGSFDRRALPLAADDVAAKKVVSNLCDQFGFDPVDVGALSEGWKFETGTPVYCIRFNKDWILKALAAAERKEKHPLTGIENGMMDCNYL